MSFWCRRGVCLQKFTIVSSDSFLERFLSVCGWFWERFWEPKRYQNAFKTRSKFLTPRRDPTSPDIHQRNRGAALFARSFAEFLGFLGLILRPWGSKGCRWEPFWGSWGCFGRSKGCLWGSFWVSWGTPGGLWRAVCSKDPWCLSRPPLFGRFLSRNGAPKASKMKLKSIKNPFKNRSIFWLDF